MAGEFAALKRQMRRDVHDAFAVEASYRAPQASAAVVLFVRYHNKKIVGDQANDGYAVTLDTIDSLVFDRDELEAKGVRLQASDLVLLKDYDNALYRLDTMRPADGPVNVEWQVTRLSGGPK